MTESEMLEINRWMEKSNATAPSGTLSLLFYNRDGTVQLGHNAEPIHWKEWERIDFLTARKLAIQLLTSTFKTTGGSFDSEAVSEAEKALATALVNVEAAWDAELELRDDEQ